MREDNHIYCLVSTKRENVIDTDTLNFQKDFFKALMLKLGFAEKWVKLLMYCISSVSYQVIINGEAKGRIQSSRKLRQGDPLSPFMFIICTEPLISLLKGTEEERRITELRIVRASPSVSHILFADDSLFFCKAEVLQCAEIFNTIKLCGDASGKLMNPNKSSIIFGSKVPNMLRREIKIACCINSEGGHWDISRTTRTNLWLQEKSLCLCTR